MANNPSFYDIAGTTAMNAQTALLVVAGGTDSTLQILSGTQPSLDGALTGSTLVTLTFAGTAFPASAASGGTVTATANAIASGTVATAGTAGYFAVVRGAGGVFATGTCGTASTDLIMSNTVLAAGGTVSCSGFVISQPQT